MNCPHCHAAVPDGSLFCPDCGTPLAQEKPSGASAPEGNLRCTACGATLPAGSRFCTRCGHSLSGVPQEARAQVRRQQEAFWDEVDTEAREQKKRRRRSNAVGWLVRLALLAVLALLIRYAMN